MSPEVLFNEHLFVQTLAAALPGPVKAVCTGWTSAGPRHMGGWEH